MDDFADRFDPVERQQQKQLSRESDCARLRSGEISRENLRRENSLFSDFDISKARIVNRRRRQARAAMV